ncbi:hypothetical protein A5642_09350 [Mycolicibacterium mucogenicum]|uniref:HTH tetR-type domain-containing protein n=1 Tax=Mycolicibacterium mucogenicum TaxID=56689 RepID=A0A1A0N540_MYCMU|nr:TetR/AcrR family transcriptional regulator [Mycolicibacterium mucogenicum]OBA92441.1 hypothetical protein A5642_09350 [Mycolicibacterium mucogenicum]
MAVPTDTPKPNRTARRKAETRTRLVEAGRAVISRKGVEAATIGEIAESADVAVGSFYNYFSTKEELLDAVIDEALELHGQAMDALTADLSDPASIVAIALYSTLAAAADNPVWGWLVVRVAFTHESLVKRLGARLLADVRRGIDEDRFHITDPVLTEYVIGGALIGCLRARLDGEVDASADVEFVAYALRLLGLTTGEAAELAVRFKPEESGR